MLTAIEKQVSWQDWSYRFLSKFLTFRKSDPLPIDIHRKRVYILPTRFASWVVLSGAQRRVITIAANMPSKVP